MRPSDGTVPQFACTLASALRRDNTLTTLVASWSLRLIDIILVGDTQVAPYNWVDHTRVNHGDAVRFCWDPFLSRHINISKSHMFCHALNATVAVERDSSVNLLSDVPKDGPINNYTIELA